MGMSQVKVADAFLKSQTPAAGADPVGLTFVTFPVRGWMTTHPLKGAVTDSAAAGTALATGYKTLNGRLGIDGEGRRLTTIAELAHAAGYKVGILSSVKLNHATPGAFYAHQPSRDMYAEISMDLARSGFDFFGGGGLPETDGQDGDAMERIYGQGYRIVANRAGFDNLTKKPIEKTIVFAAGQPAQSLPNVIDGANPITLADVTGEAIRQLENPKGFFMMVEGGKIDWAGHGNDGTSNVLETIDMDHAIDHAFAFYKRHPNETLIVVTADHETGGMKLDKDYAKKASALGGRRMSGDAIAGCVNQLLGKPEAERSFEALLAVIYDAVPMFKDTLTDEEKAAIREAYEVAQMPADKRPKTIRSMFNYGPRNPVSVTVLALADARAGVRWSSFDHSATPVPVFAIGAGAERFAGTMDNVDIPRRMMVLMGLSPAEPAAMPEKE
jgi:alkaline phosphatase